MHMLYINCLKSSLNKLKSNLRLCEIASFEEDKQIIKNNMQAINNHMQRIRKDIESEVEQ